MYVYAHMCTVISPDTYLKACRFNMSSFLIFSTFVGKNMCAFIDCRKSMFSTKHASAHNYVNLQAICDASMYSYVMVYVCMYARTYVVRSQHG